MATVDSRFEQIGAVELEWSRQPDTKAGPDRYSMEYITDTDAEASRPAPPPAQQQQQHMLALLPVLALRKVQQGMILAAPTQPVPGSHY